MSAGTAGTTRTAVGASYTAIGRRAVARATSAADTAVTGVTRNTVAAGAAGTTRATRPTGITRRGIAASATGSAVTDRTTGTTGATNATGSSRPDICRRVIPGATSAAVAAGSDRCPIGAGRAFIGARTAGTADTDRARVAALTALTARGVRLAAQTTLTAISRRTGVTSTAAGSTGPEVGRPTDPTLTAGTAVAAVATSTGRRTTGRVEARATAGTRATVTGRTTGTSNTLSR